MMEALPLRKGDAPSDILVCPDARSLFAAAAETIADEARIAIEEHGRFSFVLSGGSTPKGLYELLASPSWLHRIPWQHTHLFWGDERWVPATDPTNNYRMTLDAMIAKVPIPEANVHRMQTDSGTPKEAANAYEQELKNFFKGDPVFDFVLLGLGSNGHTASLFPHRPVLHDHSHWVAADHVDEVGMYRITLTTRALNAARTVAFLIAGPDKAQVVLEVMKGPRDPERLPAQLIAPTSGDLRWLLDAGAASRLR